MWDRVKSTERFRFVNKSKIVHVVVDDVDVTRQQEEHKIWSMEWIQDKVGLEKVKKWANVTGQLGRDTQPES